MTCQKCGYSGVETGTCPRCGAPAAKGPVDPLAELESLYSGAGAPPRATPAAVRPTPRAGPAPVPSGPRPTSMTVIGWLFIVGSVFAALAAVAALLAFNMAQQQMRATEMPEPPPDAPLVFHLMAAIMPFFGLLALVQLAIAAFVLYAASQFLKRRAWARTALESVTWLAILGMVGTMLLWGYTWVSMASRIPAQPGAPSPTSFTLFGVIVGVLAYAIYLVPLAVIVGFLRGRTIKSAVVR